MRIRFLQSNDNYMYTRPDFSCLLGKTVTARNPRKDGTAAIVTAKELVRCGADCQFTAKPFFFYKIWDEYEVV